MRPALRHILFGGRGGPVPSRTGVYKTTLTDTANADLSTFLGVDIGTPHPKRVVILTIYRGINLNGQVTATVNGIMPYHEDNSGTSLAANSILLFLVPTGTVADILVSATGSQRKAVGVSVFYPASPVPIGGDRQQATTTTDSVITVPVRAGGAVFYIGSMGGTLGAFGTTWSGPDAVVEDVDAQLEATASYTMGHINITLDETAGGVMTLAETVSGTKYLNAISLGPPYPG